MEREAPAEGPLTGRERLSAWLERARFWVYMTLVLVLLGIGFLWNRMFIVIPAGSRGVMYRTVYGGTVTDRVWGEGLHIIPPWDRMTAYDIRLKQETVKFNVLSDEGLALGVQVVVRHRPREDMLGFLQRDIGQDYFDRLIRPEVEAQLRKTFGSRPAHEIYASVRDVLQEIGQFPLIGRTEMTDKGPVSRPYMYVYELRLVGVELPKIVEDAITEKYRQEQLMLAYRYRLESEQREADRKRTEAAGIRDFNQIAGRVSPDMLRWRSIDAALELARSQNSKVVVLGGGTGGLTMQLNMGDTLPGRAAGEEAAPRAVAGPAIKPGAGKTRPKERAGGLQAPAAQPPAAPQEPPGEAPAVVR